MARSDIELERVPAARRYADSLSGPAHAHAVQTIHSWIYGAKIPTGAKRLPEVARTLAILDEKI